MLASLIGPVCSSTPALGASRHSGMTHPSKPESKNKRSWSDGDLAVLGGVSGFVAWLASTRMGATANYLDVVDQAEVSRACLSLYARGSR